MSNDSAGVTVMTEPRSELEQIDLDTAQLLVKSLYGAVPHPSGNTMGFVVFNETAYLMSLESLVAVRDGIDLVLSDLAIHGVTPVEVRQPQ